MSRRATILGLSLSLTVVVGGCAPPEPGEAPAVIEIEDVGPAADAEIDLSGDEVAKRRALTLGGQLPSGFPASLPVYQPATIVDIGEGGLGGYVLFETPAAPATVSGWLRSSLARAGWSVGDQSGGVLEVSDGSLSARITVADAGPVTSIRVEY